MRDRVWTPDGYGWSDQGPGAASVVGFHGTLVQGIEPEKRKLAEVDYSTRVRKAWITRRAKAAQA